MRAFKNLDKKEEIELRSLFPTFYLDELHDDESILKFPISIWDKWYKDVIDKENEPPFDCSEKEELERYNQLYGIASDIVKSYEVYGIFYGRAKLKKVRCKDQLLRDLCNHKFTMRPLLIPSLNAIYNVTWDYTAYIYCKDANDAQAVLKFAYARKLKQINYT